MSGVQKGARFVLFLLTLGMTLASVIIATAAPAPQHRDWKAVAIDLWVAVGLLVINLGLGEVTVKRGRT